MWVLMPVTMKEKAKLSGSHRNVVISRGKTPALA
jgi:hypothetical protein